jgi:hypothetical protein
METMPKLRVWVSLALQVGNAMDAKQSKASTTIIMIIIIES